MKITDQHGTDITNLLAPDDAPNAIHSSMQTTISAEVAADGSPQPKSAPSSLPSPDTSQTHAPSDNTFSDLCARHAAQHVTAHADLCAGNVPAAATPLPDYTPTPGEEALNAALSMIAAHVDSALRAIGNLNERLAKLESQPHDNGKLN